MTMKKLSVMVSTALAAAAFFVMPAQAEEGKIEAGIFVNDIDLSGLTQDEAAKEIEAYVAGFGDAQITLHAPEEGEIIVSAADLGLQWGNREILDEAVNFGRDGDVLQCYKELRDLQYQNKRNANLRHKGIIYEFLYFCKHSGVSRRDCHRHFPK